MAILRITPQQNLTMLSNNWQYLTILGKISTQLDNLTLIEIKWKRKVETAWWIVLLLSLANFAEFSVILVFQWFDNYPAKECHHFRLHTVFNWKLKGVLRLLTSNVPIINTVYNWTDSNIEPRRCSVIGPCNLTSEIWKKWLAVGWLLGVMAIGTSC